MFHIISYTTYKDTNIIQNINFITNHIKHVSEFLFYFLDNMLKCVKHGRIKKDRLNLEVSDSELLR